jgi:GMP synthase (glutamine-hydrolysing)
VEPGPGGPEIGPALVAKRDVAADDPLFAPVPFTPDVVQWHHDGISELPPGAVLLASSPKYPNQAFRVGAAAYGLQFHIETTPEIVRHWADSDRADLDARGIDRERLLARLDEAHADVRDVWEPFTRRFADLAHGYHRRHGGDGADGGPGGGQLLR